MKDYEKFQRARQLSKMKKYSEAIKILRELYAIEPNDNYLKFELSRLLVKNKYTFDEGKQMLIELLSTKSRNFALLELGKVEVNGDINKARVYFEELLLTDSRSYALLEIGKLEMRVGNLDKSRKYFLELSEYSSKRAYAVLELGRLEVKANNFDKAREYFEELLNSKRDRPFAILELGKLEVILGNIKNARKYFKELLNSPKDRPFAVLELGRLEVTEGNFGKAITYFKEILDSPKDRPFAVLELGKLEVKRENYDKAREYFNELLDSKRDRALALLELGKLESKNMNFIKARECFEELLNNPKDRYFVLFELGKLEMNVGNLDKAREYFNELLLIEFNSNVKLSLGKLEILEGNYETAEKYFNSISDIYNDSVLRELLFLEIRCGNYLKAYSLLDKIISDNLLDVKVIRNISFYLKYKLNLLSDDEVLNVSNYFSSMLVDYNEEKVIKHIKHHLDENSFKDRHGTFKSNIDIRELFYYVKDNIEDFNIFDFSIVDKYIVKFSDVIGMIDDKDTDSIMVVTFPNTKDIIAIYPIVSFESLVVIDKRKVLLKR